MSIRVTGLTRLAVTSLAGCLTPQEAACVSTTLTTATFNLLTTTHAVRLVLQAQARHPDRGSAAYHSMDSIVTKLRALALPPEDPPAEPLPFPALLTELARLEDQVTTLLRGLQRGGNCGPGSTTLTGGSTSRGRPHRPDPGEPGHRVA